jgi:hypothetical protein
VEDICGEQDCISSLTRDETSFKERGTMSVTCEELKCEEEACAE